MLYKIISILLTVLLTSCSNNIDYSKVIQPIYIENSNNYETQSLIYSLKQSLNGDGLLLTNNIESAKAIVIISDVKKSTDHEIKEKLSSYTNIFYKSSYSAKLKIKFKDNEQVKDIDTTIQSTSPNIILNNQNNFNHKNDPQLFQELQHDLIIIIKNKLIFTN